MQDIVVSQDHNCSGLSSYNACNRYCTRLYLRHNSGTKMCIKDGGALMRCEVPPPIKHRLMIKDGLRSAAFSPSRTKYRTTRLHGLRRLCNQSTQPLQEACALFPVQRNRLPRIRTDFLGAGEFGRGPGSRTGGQKYFGSWLLNAPSFFFSSGAL